jgi:diamine N-acetyltransferase
VIILRKINKENWEECVNLYVTDEQNVFIPSNLHSIAESKFNEKIKLFGIYKELNMIGFTAYCLDVDGDMNLTKFMIDRRYQGNGYGIKALDKVMNLIKKETIKNEVWLSLHPNNISAIKLYNKYGFKKEVLGFETEDEIFFKYIFKF